MSQNCSETSQIVTLIQKPHRIQKVLSLLFPIRSVFVISIYVFEVTVNMHKCRIKFYVEKN